MASPASVTSIEAPVCAGADWKVATTVPMPMVWPASQRARSSSRTSRTGHHLRQAPRRRPASGRRRGRRCGAGGRRSLPGSVGSRAPRCGFAQRTRWDRVWRRRTCSPRASGASCSQPSLKMTTTAPRAMPLRPQRRRKTSMPSASLVPPDQSGIASPAATIARSASRWRSARVTWVQSGAEVNTSTGAPLDEAVSQPEQGVGIGTHRAGDIDEQDDPTGSRAATSMLDPPGLPSRVRDSRRVRRASSSPRAAGVRRWPRRRGARGCTRAKSRWRASFSAASRVATSR